MSTLKTVEISSLQPGDAFTFDGESHVYRVEAAWALELGHDHKWDGYHKVHARDGLERFIEDFRESGEQVTTGYTNRKAKRQRCKARRRARLRTRDQLTGSFIDDVDN